MSKDMTAIVVVQDKSGSMASLVDDTIGGFNDFVRRQRELPGEVELTLVQFNSTVDFVYSGLPLAQVPELTRATYVVGGGTALFEAIGQAIVRTDARLAAMAVEERPGKVVLVVMTDGHNTDRSEFTRERVSEMITKRQDNDGWQFIYIGAAFDAMGGGEHALQAASFGISNAAAVSNNSVGTRAAYSGASEAIHRYRSGASADASLDAADMGSAVLTTGGEALVGATKLTIGNSADKGVAGHVADKIKKPTEV